MNQVLVVYSTKNDLKELAQGLKEGFESSGVQVDLEQAEQRNRPLSFAKYDLVMVGSPVLGFLGGKVDKGIEEFLNECKGTTGQKAIAFTDSALLGSSKSLKKIMKKLEAKGCLVYDFRSFKDLKAAKEYSQKIKLEN